MLKSHWHWVFWSSKHTGLFWDSCKCQTWLMRRFLQIILLEKDKYMLQTPQYWLSWCNQPILADKSSHRWSAWMSYRQSWGSLHQLADCNSIFINLDHKTCTIMNQYYNLFRTWGLTRLLSILAAETLMKSWACQSPLKEQFTQN